MSALTARYFSLFHSPLTVFLGTGSNNMVQSATLPLSCLSHHIWLSFFGLLLNPFPIAMWLLYWWFGRLLTNSKNYFILFLTHKTCLWAASDTGSTFICLVFWAFYLLVFLRPYPNGCCQRDKMPQPPRTHVGFTPPGATDCWETGPWSEVVNSSGPRF